MTRARLLPLLLLVLASCGDRAAPTPAPTPPAPPPTTATPVAPPAAATVEEACGQLLLVAWKGAEHAPEAVTRSESDARARAEELLARLEQGEAFNELARTESDAPSSAARGGVFGTFSRDEWPPLHAALREPLFALGVGQLSAIIPAPYGFAIVKRCPVEKVHTRHVLIRYRDAKNAPPEIRRSREAALAIAEEIRATLASPRADFASIAARHSEDSTKDQGGDVGNVGRGRLAVAYENAAFALRPGELSGVVETEYGFHVIQRVP